MATRYCTLAWKTPWTEEPVRLQSMESQRVGHDWVTPLSLSYGGGNEDNGDLPQKVPGMYHYTQCPQPCSRPPPTHASAEDSWTLTGKSVSLGQSLLGSLLLSPGSWWTQGSVCAFQGSISQSRQLYCGVNGSLFQEGLHHTQVHCTQSPCLCSSPLLTCTSTGDPETQFCLSLCGMSGSGVHKVCLSLLSIWQVWGLILKVISPLLLSCWGFSFALGCVVAPHSCSSPAQPRLQCLLSCWGFSALGRGISSDSLNVKMQLSIVLKQRTNSNSS